MKNQLLPENKKYADIIFTDENGIHKVVRRCELEEATEFCLRPANLYNYVSKTGYRVKPIDNLIQ